jgi:hypothetical protein
VVASTSTSGSKLACFIFPPKFVTFDAISLLLWHKDWEEKETVLRIRAEESGRPEELARQGKLWEHWGASKAMAYVIELGRVVPISS